jgi:hypothetical protein
MEISKYLAQFEELREKGSKIVEEKHKTFKKSKLKLWLGILSLPILLTGALKAEMLIFGLPIVIITVVLLIWDRIDLHPQYKRAEAMKEVEAEIKKLKRESGEITAEFRKRLALRAQGIGMGSSISDKPTYYNTRRKGHSS